MDKSVINNKIKLAESIINRELKQKITQKGYVKSGRMKKETFVNISLDGDGKGIDVVLNSTNYFPKIDEKADITGEVFASKIVLDAIGDIYSAIISSYIPEQKK